MPFTLIHAFIGYIAIAPFTKDRKLRLLGFIGGLWPDLDAISLLFGNEAYLHYHKLMHPLVFGVLFGVLAAIIAGRFFKMGRMKSFAAFTAGFFLHIFFDLFFTDWAIRLLWPFSQQLFIWPLFINQFILLHAMATLAFLVVLFLERKER